MKIYINGADRDNYIDRYVYQIHTHTHTHTHRYAHTCVCSTHLALKFMEHIQLIGYLSVFCVFDSFQTLT